MTLPPPITNGDQDRKLPEAAEGSDAHHTQVGAFPPLHLSTDLSGFEDVGMLSGEDGENNEASKDDEVTYRMYFSRLVKIADRAGLFLLIFGVFSLAFVSASMLFEILYPFDMPAEQLFSKSQVGLTTIQRYTDLVFGGANMGIGMVQPLIPFWNSVSNYMVEPMIFIMVEIIATVISGNPELFFVLDEEEHPFGGYTCSASDVVLDARDGDRAFTSQAWCGLFGYYVNGVTAMENAAEYAHNQRRMSADPESSLPPYGTADTAELRRIARNLIALPRGSARRLSDASGVPTLPVGSLDDFVIVVQRFVGAIIELFGTVVDLIMHLIYLVFDEVAVALAKLIMTMIQVIGQVVYQLVSSGFFTRLVTMSLDFITILAFDIAVPLLFAFMDAIKCLLHLFDQESWDAELRCISEHCFLDDGDGAADLLVFTSTFIVLDQVYKVIQDTWNEGRRMVGLPAESLSSFEFWKGGETWAANHTSGCARYTSCPPLPPSAPCTYALCCGVQVLCVQSVLAPPALSKSLCPTYSHTHAPSGALCRCQSSALLPSSSRLWQVAFRHTRSTHLPSTCMTSVAQMGHFTRPCVGRRPAASLTTRHSLRGYVTSMNRTTLRRQQTAFPTWPLDLDTTRSTAFEPRTLQTLGCVAVHALPLTMGQRRLSSFSTRRARSPTRKQWRAHHRYPAFLARSTTKLRTTYSAGKPLPSCTISARRPLLTGAIALHCAGVCRPAWSGATALQLQMSACVTETCVWARVARTDLFRISSPRRPRRT